MVMNFTLNYRYLHYWLITLLSLKPCADQLLALKAFPLKLIELFLQCLRANQR